MNRLRCLLFAATVIISSATFALGGDMQGPAKSDPPPPPPALVEQAQIVLPDATTMLMEILLTIF